MVGEEQQLDANPILKTALISNNPNPFASTTSIRFSLKESGKVRLDVFDLQGRLVKILKSEELGSGPHEVQWDRRDKAGERVNPGIYFYRLIVGEFIDTKKMVVLR
jgi:flagellar hook assembly protein FlgD